MNHISELSDILNESFQWNKTRITFFALMLIALITTRTVNWSKLANAIASNADKKSRYPRLVIAQLMIFFGTITLIWADGGYTGTKLIDWALSLFNIVWTVVKRPRKIFKIVKFRWIVERTFGWMNYQRRLSKDYEFLPLTSEAFVKFAAIGMMMRRIRPG